ncbi:MAG: cyclic nucleotide-binding domain-containing protein [Planctomycetaceae bacterium]|jgi:CRP/FNR family transcriptional regulator, cyclic AMP receptor protein|nr:cyclic nucleotide-binding domain-containing protein [Planctomycetaceae bacterium]MBT6155676.1 cyclic nucleotide-binding domain-containing protein [Planctomycetaceae bacterium]MBT6486312.1 cyclic nucleotide-binding domain-containing protein [Planctomycetaceae bacterium]MBT6497555.1 cyclic nucleotide-binding domain-containing protein [Planctomycetaceae bacterium]
MPESAPPQPDRLPLEHCVVFQEMTPEEKQPVLALMEHETYPAGETILREGLSIQILWIIVRGQCEVVKTTSKGSEQQLAVLGPCAVFGEMSFFHEAAHSASVRTLTEVEVMRLSRGAYDELTTISPSAAHKVASSTANILADRLRQMDDWVCHLVERPEGAGHRKEWHDFRAKLYSDWEF